MKDMILPDMKRLQLEFLVNYGNELLKLNNLKVGDEIEIEFDYEGTSSGYKTRERSKYTYKKLAKGVLKLDENGCLYSESIDEMPFYEHTKDGRSYYYKQVMRRSIKRFGVGFIY